MSGIHFTPLTPAQRKVARAYQSCDILFVLGEAGGGKTHCALALALQDVLGDGKKKKLLLARPLVACGESLGYLKGDLNEKLGPWHGALSDVLSSMSFLKVADLLSKGTVELTPLGLMRGRTVGRAVAVLTEAQNCTLAQLKMFLSRLGEHGKLIIEGDPTQADIPGRALLRVANALRGLPGVGVVRIPGGQCVRHPLVPDVMKRLKGI